MADTIISLRNVSKHFPGSSAPAVSDLSMDVLEGETVVLVGPSGCGKSTTMKMINRLIELSGGSVQVAGQIALEQDPVRLRRGIGYVIQGVGLMPHRRASTRRVPRPALRKDRSSA